MQKFIKTNKLHGLIPPFSFSYQKLLRNSTSVKNAIDLVGYVPEVPALCFPPKLPAAPTEKTGYNAQHVASCHICFAKSSLIYLFI